MPIYEYLSPDGVRHERIYLVASDAPSILTVDGKECPRVPSVTVNKFKGSFSGGTAGKDRVHLDDGSVVEPGRLKDVKRRRKELDQKRDDSRRKSIEKSLADFTT